MVEAVMETGSRGVTKCAAMFAKAISDLGSEIDFDHFQRFDNQVTENQIKLVSSTDLLERNTGRKLMSLVLERQTVSTEPIIVDMSEKRLRRGSVGNC